MDTIDPGALKAKAGELGFELCGIAPAGAFPELSRLRAWLDQGHAGDMHYLARTADYRADVRAVLPSARSVIVVGMVYNTDRPYSTEIGDQDEAVLSRYAWGDDYHDILGARLGALLRWMREQVTSPFEACRYVDTGPVQERVYAQRAGLGWIGKNTCLINPDVGSWVFLGEIICSLALVPDPPGLDRCGTCTLCLDACPTGALVGPGTLDSTRCISYLTIELKGALPVSLREGVSSHVYGCDICQEVCPWNGTAAVSPEGAWLPRVVFDRTTIAGLWQRSDAELRHALRGNAMRHAGVRKLRRNLAVALGNRGTAEARELLTDAIGDSSRPSVANALVAPHVEWAKAQCG